MPITVLLPEGYEFKPLHLDDYNKGYLPLLEQLTQVGNITQQTFQTQFEWFQKHADIHRIIVIKDTQTNQCVATGSIMVERKFIHECGQVGHVEDIVVCESTRGKKLGKALIDQLIGCGKDMGCYKVLLSCAEKNVGFYEKCLLNRKEITMAHYFK
ncbi:acyl-CoA N-acyltransferase [Globomyces pollinis-pini]|nr:acyl-CoA N-acyltransferase [Globomyces pollinis-pini]